MDRSGGKKEKSQGPGKKPKGPQGTGDKKEKSMGPDKKPKGPQGTGGKKEKSQGPGKKPNDGPGVKKEKPDTKKDKTYLSNNNGQGKLSTTALIVPRLRTCCSRQSLLAECPTACVDEIRNGEKTGRQTCCGEGAAWANKCKKYTGGQARIETKPHSWKEGLQACLPSKHWLSR